MKIAVIHDWLVTYTGAEKVLEQILDIYPDADIFCVVNLFNEDKSPEFLKNKNIQTTFIQNLPFVKKKYRNYLFLMPLAIEQLDLSSYDLVISSSHAVAKGVITGPDQLHISYIHTPIRYAWDLQHQYLNETGLVKGIKSIMARTILHYIRLWDYRTVSGVDYFISNSHFIAKRVFKLYKKKSKVIFPPVDTESFTFSSHKEDFYVTASRLVPYKKIDLIVEAFSHISDKKLYVIGDGPDIEKIREKAGENVTILGYQPDDVLKSYMQKAKAFIFAAEEDFGITPVEAQACGTPVIAFGKGGALDTIKALGTCNQPTGVLFNEQSVSSIKNAVELFENNYKSITPENCRINSLRFSNERFKTEFNDFVLNSVNRFNKSEFTISEESKVVIAEEDNKYEEITK